MLHLPLDSNRISGTNVGLVLLTLVQQAKDNALVVFFSLLLDTSNIQSTIHLLSFKMGSCFGKKPSTLKPGSEKIDYNREFTSISGSHNMLPHKQRMLQQQPNGPHQLGRVHPNQIRSASNSVSTTGNSFHLQQGHLQNSDSAVTNSTSATNSSVADNSEPLNKFNKNAYIALFDYAARTIEDLSFKKGKQRTFIK